MFTKNIRFGLVLLVLVLSFSGSACACVGRTLYIGARGTVGEKLLTEMLELLINERTGTTVKTRYFDNTDQLYQALKSNIEESRVDIIVEDTERAAALLKIPRNSDLSKEYSIVKKRYEEEFAVIWLNPFGFTQKNGQTGRSFNATLVRLDVLNNFPLLPRVLNKLAGAINNEVLKDLLAKVKSGEKRRNVARDFLMKMKFI